MALGVPELHQSIEDTFQVWVDERAASQARDVQDLHRVVFPACQSVKSHCFYRLGTAFMQVADVPRHQLTDSTPVERLIPQGFLRRQIWPWLSLRLGGRLPRLRRPEWLGGMLRSFAVLALAGLLGWATGILPAGRAVGLAAGFLMIGIAGYHLTLPMADRLPNDCRTLGGLAQTALRLNFHVLARSRPQWSEREVLETLHRLVAEHEARA